MIRGAHAPSRARFGALAEMIFSDFAGPRDLRKSNATPVTSRMSAIASAAI